MKKLTVLTVLLASSLAFAHIFVPGKKQDRPILLKGGDLYTVSGGVLAQTDLLFDKGRITQIGKNISAPANAEIIDVTGKRIYPGLIDGYSSLGLVEIDLDRATIDINEAGDVTPEVQSQTAYNPDSEVIPTIRTNGVLLSLIAPRGGTISGRSSLMNLDGWTKEDAVENPNVGLHVNWPEVAIITAWWMDKSAEEQKKEMAEAREALRDAFESGRSYAKAKKAGTLTQTDLRWDAMAPVFDKQMPVFIYADDMRQIQEAIAFGVEQDVKIVIVGGLESYRVASLLKEHNIAVVLGRVHSLPKREDDNYDAPFRLPSVLEKAGVKFCFSHYYPDWASSYPGSWGSRSLPFQAAQAIGFGLDPATALRALTLSAAEIFGAEKEIGSLDVGKKATLVVSDGDIMDPITQRVVRAYIGGREVDLNNKHKELYEKYRVKSYPEK